MGHADGGVPGSRQPDNEPHSSTYPDSVTYPDSNAQPDSGAYAEQ